MVGSGLRALMAAPGVELAGYQVASTPLSKAHGVATAWMLRAYQWSDKRVFERQDDTEDLCDLSASLSSVDRFENRTDLACSMYSSF